VKRKILGVREKEKNDKGKYKMNIGLFGLTTLHIIKKIIPKAHSSVYWSSQSCALLPLCLKFILEAVSLSLPFVRFYFLS